MAFDRGNSGFDCNSTSAALPHAAQLTPTTFVAEAWIHDKFRSDACRGCPPSLLAPLALGAGKARRNRDNQHSG